MRELSSQEIQQVSGGVAPWVGAAAGGFAFGAITSGSAAYLSGASWQSTLTSATLGGFAGATGGIASVTTGALRAINTVRSAGLSVASSLSASGQGTSDVGDVEKVLEK